MVSAFSCKPDICHLGCLSLSGSSVWDTSSIWLIVSETFSGVTTLWPICFSTSSRAALATLRHTSVVLHRGRVLATRYFSGCGFGQGVQRQLKIGHIVAKILFGQTFEMLVLPCCHATPRFGEDVGQYSKILLLFHARTFPFVGSPRRPSGRSAPGQSSGRCAVSPPRQAIA